MTTTTATTSEPDLALVKTRQQETWASGDYTVIAGRIVLVSELLAENADLHGSAITGLRRGRFLFLPDP